MKNLWNKIGSQIVNLHRTRKQESYALRMLKPRIKEVISVQNTAIVCLHDIPARGLCFGCKGFGPPIGYGYTIHHRQSKRKDMGPVMNVVTVDADKRMREINRIPSIKTPAR